MLCSVRGGLNKGRVGRGVADARRLAGTSSTQASAAEREQVHRRSPLLRKVLRSCLPLCYLSDQGGTAPPERQCMQLSCTPLIPTVQRKSPSHAMTNLCLRDFFKSSSCTPRFLFFSEEHYFQRGSRCLAEIWFCSGGVGVVVESAGPVALAQSRLAWFRKAPLSAERLALSTLHSPACRAVGGWLCLPRVRRVQTRSHTSLHAHGQALRRAQQAPFHFLPDTKPR